MNYTEALEYVHSIPKFRRPLGNEQLARLLKAMGNPQDKLKFIHIAGTNGKGSVASMLAGALERSGYVTGLFTSPYIEVFNERIRINGMMIPDDALADFISRVRTLMEENDAYVSEFAFITAASFLYFYENGCDYVVLETGMGGKLDATNIIKTPVLCILTSISLDHMQYLGDTIEDIAREKCGIIKDNVPVISYPNGAVRGIIEEYARRHDSQLIFAKAPERTEDGFIYNGEHYALALKGAYQPKNAAVVIEAAAMLGIGKNELKTALANASWMARYEFMRDNLVIDGCHNEDGVRELVKSLKEDGRHIFAVTAMMEDKSIKKCMELIAGAAERVYCTQLDMPRCAAAETLADIVCSCGSEAVVYKNAAEAVNAALDAADDNTLICVCGSLYLAGEVRRMF